jgi:diacylglycerol kinase family enzyme
MFFEVAGAGWDATLFPVGEQLKRWNLAGVISAARGTFGFRTDEVSLLLDGTRRVVSRTPTVVVANGPYFGSSFAVAPGSRLDDGLLTVTLFEGFRKADLLAYFASVAEGQARADPRVVSHRAARVEVLAPPGLPAHADGEPVGPVATPFEALQGALTVIAPPVTARTTMKWAAVAPPEGPAPAPPRTITQTLRWKVPAPPDTAGNTPPESDGGDSSGA